MEPVRLTKQGVRDLDYGVKRKPAPIPVPDQEPGPVVEGVEVEVIDGKASRSRAGSAPSGAPPEATAVVVP
jgi:hypothetical protein